MTTVSPAWAPDFFKALKVTSAELSTAAEDFFPASVPGQFPAGRDGQFSIGRNNLPNIKQQRPIFFAGA